MFIKFANADVLEARIARPGEGLLKSAHKATFTYEPREGYLYVRSRAISSRTNDNFDSWPADELQQAWETFIGKPVFVNHHNDEVKRKRGVIIDAALHEDISPDGTPDVWIEVLMEIDAIRFPKLAASILAGDIERTSMGADVGESECSYCGNVATTPSTYCAHIKSHKGRRLARRNIDGSEEQVLVHEICRKISFFENSVLVEPPADPTAFFLGVDDSGVRSLGMTAKTAKISSDAYVELTEEQKQRFAGTTVRQDGDGFYCHTHRARGKSHPSIDEIPDAEIGFIESTGAKTALFEDEVQEEMTKMATKNKRVWRKTAGALDYGPLKPGPDAGTRWEGIASLPSSRAYKVVVLWPGDEAPLLSAVVDSEERAQEWGQMCVEAGGIHVTIENAGTFTRVAANSLRPTIQRAVKHAREVTQNASSNSRVEYCIWDTDLTASTPEEAYAASNTGDLIDFIPANEAHTHQNVHDKAVMIFNVYAMSRGQRDLLDQQVYWIDGDDLYWVRRGSGQKVAKTAGTQAESDALLAKTPDSIRDRVAKIIPFTVYGPGYNRNATENVYQAVRFAAAGNTEHAEIFLRKAESQVHFAETGEWINPMTNQTQMFGSKTASMVTWNDDPTSLTATKDGFTVNQIAYDGQHALIVFGDPGQTFHWTVEDRNNGDYVADGAAQTEERAKRQAEEAHLNASGGQLGMFGSKTAKEIDTTWYEKGRADAESGRPSEFDHGALPADTSDEARELAQDSYFDGYRQNDPDREGHWIGGERVGSIKTAWGETKAPPRVNTLGLTECPVCGTTNQFDSTGRCMTCGHLPAPEPFREPDLEVAQKVDMRDGWVNPNLLSAPAFVPPAEGDAGGEENQAPNPDPVQKAASTTEVVEGLEGDTMRPSAAIIARQDQEIHRLAAENAVLRRRAGLAPRRADVDNPAQPVEEPAPGASTQSTDDTRAADTTTEVTSPGAAITDVGPMTTTEVTTPGAVSTDVAPDATTEVTTPVAGATEMPSYEQSVTLVQPDASGASNGTDKTNAFDEDNSWVQSQANLVRQRTYACLRLAKLRVQAGLASGDELVLAQQIEASKPSNDTLRAEIATLSQVIERQASIAPRTARREPVRSAPSLASAGAPPMGRTASANGEMDSVLW